MSRKRRRTPEEFVNVQNERRNRQLDRLVMQTHLNAKPPERISDAEFEEIIMNTHLGSKKQEKISTAEFERRVGQTHLSRASST